MKKTVLVVVATAVLVSACTTTDPYTGDQKISNTAAGAGLGALAGASLGLLAGGNDRRNALAGGAIGATMDQNEAELRRQLEGTGVSVTRSGDQIILNMPSDITFNSDQDAVKPGFYQVLNSVALVLKKFKQTTVDVFGHTDSTGGDQHNFDLSQRRALAVANYLSGQGVDQRRFAVTGFGKTRPVASNATAEGRAQNRRVEIQLSPLT
ncbi:OmpA family protein [Mesorhizobium sp. M7A.F.Ca.MR.245.00.0.0]|uniref:OmpA family protein n=1 Tax=Mesorhizobium sp. M7A.F.Ca.MR.245.00.0.0 TaxID=2496778 RepID=UPI000FC9E6A8|nr:OmpA family protein [Mesorhizobium sp. M7A.F.Ca.MR.245.00.0.0]RUV17607.1 OmpA family protein [Mesorhizobium sp. M7A.F.Ca.MR.245.00.0.0]